MDGDSGGFDFLCSWKGIKALIGLMCDCIEDSLLNCLFSSFWLGSEDFLEVVVDGFNNLLIFIYRLLSNLNKRLALAIFMEKRETTSLWSDPLKFSGQCGGTLCLSNRGNCMGVADHRGHTRIGRL